MAFDRKPEVKLLQSAGVVDQNGRAMRTLGEALNKVSCNLFFDTELGAIGIRDTQTKSTSYIALTNGSLTIYADRDALCTAINS